MSNNFLRNIHPLLRTRKKQHGKDNNHAILNAIDTVLSGVEEETLKSKMQSSLKTATGEYLDTWGSWFGVYRKRKDEQDEDFRKRIVEALDIPRGTNDSIKMAIRRFLEDSTVAVEVYEPWREVFKFNSSPLNGTHHLIGDYYNIAVITVTVGQFQMIEGMDYETIFNEIIDVIDVYRPAGVTLHFNYDNSLRPITGSDNGLIAYGAPRVLTPNIQVSFTTQPNDYIRGELKLSHYAHQNKVFSLNDSLLNSEHVLAGDFNIKNPNVHLVRKTRGFNPGKGTLFGDVISGTIEVDKKYYKSLDKTDSTTITEPLNRQEQLMFTYNIGKVFDLSYPSIRRNKENYGEVLNNSLVSVTGNANKQGVLVNLEAYNFNTGSWETIGGELSTGDEQLWKGKLENAKEFLNDNLLLFVRIKATRDISITLNKVNVNYRNKEIKLKDKNYGETSVITTLPVINKAE